MSLVRVRVDAKQMTSEIQEILNRKVKHLHDDAEIYDEIYHIYYRYVRDIMPKDTGALRGIGGGRPQRGHYVRHPNLTISAEDGIVTDPYEDTPKGERHYARHALERVFGENIAEEMFMRLQETGRIHDFVQEIAPIIARGMNNG